MQDLYFARRLASLRLRKNVSAREMSLSIGQNRNYINQIENGKMFPTMQNFFVICEYLGVSARDFFDDTLACPGEVHELSELLRRLDCEALRALSLLVNRILA